MKEIEINFEMNPLVRIQIEIDATDDQATKDLGLLLKDEFYKNNLIANTYNEKQRTLENCYKALKDYALNNHRSVISDKEATGIALHYIQDGEVTKHVENKIVLSLEEKEDLKKRAYEEFIEDEKRRLKKEQDEEIEKERKAQEKHQAKEQAKYDKKCENQMSLFDI